jgi:spore coat protein A
MKKKDFIAEHRPRGIHRRNFIKTVGAGSAGAAILGAGFSPSLGTMVAEAQTGGSPTLTKFTEQLPTPSVINAKNGGTFSLPMAQGLQRFHSSLPRTPTWGYGGMPYLGPTFEAKRGVPINVIARNNLGAHPLAFAVDTSLHGAVEADKTTPRTTVHLHGGNTEARSDGHPESTFLPGNTFNYHYHNDQEATTLWYHDHALGITRLNVHTGLAGMYLMRDGRDTGLANNPIGLPAAPFEIPLIIQDQQFNADGTMAFPPGPLRIWSPEFFGDTAVVNGKVWPNLNVARGLYRFRVVNASNARFYNLFFSNFQPIFQIGSDGGLLNEPVPDTHLLIAPGERADILIDFRKAKSGTTIRLLNNAVVPFPDGPRLPRNGGIPLRNIMQFTVTNQTGCTGPVPTTLRSTPIVPLPAPSRVRDVSLVEIIDEASGEPIMGLLNNLFWDTSQIETPGVNTLEQWNIVNTTGDTHPIHIHLIQFRLLGRQTFDVPAYLAAAYPTLDPTTMGTGPHPAPSADAFALGNLKRPNPNEEGWKDTIQANPGEITRILVPFGAHIPGVGPGGVPFGRSFTGDYVWHCHILDHEDNEMMQKYQII